MLEVTGLTCGYGDIIAVDGLSFTVGAGEIFGLIGANGAGKTTTIMALAGAGRSVLLIEHNIREVARICPEIYVQDNGRRLLQGPTSQVMASPELRRAYLGGPDSNGKAA